MGVCSFARMGRTAKPCSGAGAGARIPPGCETQQRGSNAPASTKYVRMDAVEQQTRIDEAEKVPLNLETIRELWTRTYNREGRPDWSHIFPYYHQDIVFQDTIQRIEGKGRFVAMCNRLTKRTKQLRMEILAIAQNGNVIMFDWVMTMMFKKFPNTPMYGSTKLVLGEDGLIREQRDYYDLWGDIFNNIPRFGKLYRRFLVKHFG
jgi:limonene-1,2-epoxide hydrolase